jgi:carbon-monoxide dehydrogenase small subunit
MIEFTLNNLPVSIETDPNRRLLDILREDFHLTGSKEGCGEGECGACTILLDGRPVTACLVCAEQLPGRRVETVEGLVESELGQRLVDSFAEHGAVQCGFCFPGMLVVSWHYLTHHPVPSEDGVREAIAGNICRCTGYTKIIEAVLAAGKGREA